jgi:WD repeat-containing protein 68
MPFHHHHSSSGHQGAAQGIFEAAQTLGSIGAPTGNLRTATLGTTTAGTDALLLSNSSGLQHSHASALPPPNALQPAPNNFTTYDGPKRSNTIARMADHSTYQQPPHIQEPASQGAMYNNPPPQASSVPGSLQPGGTGQGRPAPLPSAYTAPTAVPQINTNASQYSLPTRSNTMHSHSHSRSSPAGLDQQKYVRHRRSHGEHLCR